jgi:hypothetical protein
VFGGGVRGYGVEVDGVGYMVSDFWFGIHRVSGLAYIGFRVWHVRGFGFGI